MILITQPRIGTSYNEILALQMAARSLGWDVLGAEGSWRLENDLIKSNIEGVPYGSQIFCEVISQQMSWKLKANSFDWLAKLPIEFTKRHVRFMSLKEAKQIKDKMFIKPADDKCFDAKIYEAGEFNPNYLIEEHYPVLTSEIAEFESEYRCFVGRSEGKFKVKTWSSYLLNGEINNPKLWYQQPLENILLQEFVEDAVNCGLDFCPSVVDVGVIKGKGLAIIESNPAWASGLYGCDPGEALLVMKEAISYEIY